ncbi:META domain-containing protein [Brachyspira hyodysenteriae]|uniref:META domain-containing protein n=1 Tax=Brachyspira hyodysenteriae TaxID=159 RepID=UPI0022CD5594|nr:META domain-containing protein [Brachyspira hyodysenteriae]MCZ9839402.1 META domain-containing protein [Brachyspira hyodysenteriae]MCZ9847051.1 META domain-containing protein [Brachyspira hyodysenteriae]MCZ9850775.1 META domain-containing protein [Brachyspira hyodysenteriae]MCZ9860472.1 META domain-containing protein [Brachyspira hyodysenteriae]MCZ9870027.1 META domain-containing protein [Brachyspira hyodysenteriae]
MKKILSLVLIVMGTVFAVSCGGNTSNATTTTENTTTAIEAPAATEVVITVNDLLGKEYSLTNMYEGKEVTIAFSDTNMLGGKSAVNNYFTEFSLDGNKLKLNALGSTKMAGPEEDMAVETEYLQILNGADTISLDGDVLTITTTSGTNLIYTFKGNVEVASENAN